MTKDAREESLEQISFKSKIILTPHLRIVAVEGVDVCVAKRVADHFHSHLAGLGRSHLRIRLAQMDHPWLSQDPDLESISPCLSFSLSQSLSHSVSLCLFFSLSLSLSQVTWISVTSRGFLASQATAALHVIVWPWVA